MKHYIIFDEDGKLLVLSIIAIDEDRIPSNAIQISDENQAIYLQAMNSTLQDVVLIDGEIQIVDKYTPAELAAQAAEQAVTQLRSEAERLHEETTEAMASDMLATFTTPEQIELTNYRIDLRLAINDPSNNPLPAKPTWLADWLTQ